MKKNTFTWKTLHGQFFDVEACIKRCKACVEIIDSDRPSLFASREHVCVQPSLTALTAWGSTVLIGNIGSISLERLFPPKSMWIRGKLSEMKEIVLCMNHSLLSLLRSVLLTRRRSSCTFQGSTRAQGNTRLYHLSRFAPHVTTYDRRTTSLHWGKRETKILVNLF